MKEFPQFILTLLLGVSAVILSVSYYENAKSAQKIKNIEKLYYLKSNLETTLTIKQTQELLSETERMVDSINAIK